VAQHGGTVRILQPRALQDDAITWVKAALAQYDSAADVQAG